MLKTHVKSLIDEYNDIIKRAIEISDEFDIKLYEVYSTTEDDPRVLIRDLWSKTSHLLGVNLYPLLGEEKEENEYRIAYAEGQGYFRL